MQETLSCMCPINIAVTLLIAQAGSSEQGHCIKAPVMRGTWLDQTQP